MKRKCIVITKEITLTVSKMVYVLDDKKDLVTALNEAKVITLLDEEQAKLYDELSMDIPNLGNGAYSVDEWTEDDTGAQMRVLDVYDEDEEQPA